MMEPVVTLLTGTVIATVKVQPIVRNAIKPTGLFQMKQTTA